MHMCDFVCVRGREDDFYGKISRISTVGSSSSGIPSLDGEGSSSQLGAVFLAATGRPQNQ